MSLTPLSPVTISGFGCVSPLGLDTGETLESLKSSRDGISPVRLFSVKGCSAQTAGQVSEELTQRASAIVARARRWTRAAQMVLCAMDEALRSRPGFQPDCIVIGTTSGGMTLGENFLRSFLTNQKIHTTARAVRNYVPHQPVLQATRVFGFDAPVRIISNACASGTNAIGVGAQLIRHGLAHRVLAGGYDELAQLVFAGFDCLKASSPEKCRPFDSERTGLSLGEGAAMFCLDAEPGSLQVAGYGSAFDAHHLTQPHPSGRGPRDAMLRALENADWAPGTVDYVNAHGTGTPLNDASEGRAILEVCPRTPVSSTKSMTGHSLGTAGAIEAAFCCLAMQNDFLPANINFRAGDADVPLDIVANAIRPATPRRVLSNSFGFGGSNATLALAYNP